VARGKLFKGKAATYIRPFIETGKAAYLGVDGKHLKDLAFEVALLIISLANKEKISSRKFLLNLANIGPNRPRAN